MHDPQIQSLTTFPSFLILLISTQPRSRWRRRLRNLHTDPSLPLSFSSVGTVFTILHASLSPYRPSPGLHCRCKICKSRRKGAELYGADRSSAASLPPGGHSIAFWRSKLEFILVLRRFRAPSFPPPSSPFGRFLVSPFASVVRWSRRPRPRPRLPFLRPMQPTMQQVWVGSPASPPCPPSPSPSPRDMQSGWIYPLKSERP